MQFVNTTINSFNSAITTALSALKDITPASATALLTSVSEAASSAFASQNENGDASTPNYRFWVATLFTSVLFIATTVCFCRRKPAPASPQLPSQPTAVPQLQSAAAAVPQLPSTPTAPTQQPPANSNSIASSSSSTASCSSDLQLSVIQPRDLSGNPIVQDFFDLYRLSNGGFVGVFESSAGQNRSIFISKSDLTGFEEIPNSDFDIKHETPYVFGNNVYIINSLINDVNYSGFYVREYNGETKQWNDGISIPVEALNISNATVGRNYKLCFEHIGDGSYIVGGPDGVVSNINSEGALISSSPLEENKSDVLSLKRHNNNIFAVLANGNILMFDENSDDIKSFKVDPAMHGIQNHDITSLHIIENQLFAWYGNKYLSSEGKILVWDLNADQTQTPTLLTSTNAKTPAVASNGLLVAITKEGIIQVWNPSTRGLVKEFDLLKDIRSRSDHSTREEGNIQTASVVCSGDRIIVRTSTSLYNLPLPSVE